MSIENGPEPFDISDMLYRLHQGDKLDMADRGAFMKYILEQAEKLNLSQVKLSELSGVPDRSLRRLEAGSAPQMSTLLSLWEAILKAREAAQPEPAETITPMVLAQTFASMLRKLSPVDQLETIRLTLDLAKENHTP